MTKRATAPAFCVLFLANGAPASKRAHAAVLDAFRQADLEVDLLEVVDVYRDPRRALEAGCMATPSLLVGDAGGTGNWFLGELSRSTEVVAFVRDLSLQAEE